MGGLGKKMPLQEDPSDRRREFHSGDPIGRYEVTICGVLLYRRLTIQYIIER